MNWISRIFHRPPDFIVGTEADPYLRRWWLIPRNRYFNIYLHQFLRDDEDRALHDHPWNWCSILIMGAYIEVSDAGALLRMAPGVLFSRAERAHRIELLNKDMPFVDLLDEKNPREPAWTIFITGPVFRNWGFHCPQGWIPWERFTKPGAKGEIGPGCNG